MAISLNLFVLFGLLEVLIILVVSGAVVTFKLRAAQRETEALSKELHKAESEIKKDIVKHSSGTAKPSRDYADLLQEQLDRSSILLGEEPQIPVDQDADDPAEVTRQMLAARHQFLQLELDMQSLSAERDVETQRQSVVEGMQALLAGLVMQPDTAEAQSATDEAADDTAVEVPVSTSLSEEQQLRGQVDFLRNVVSNQHDVMHELRQLLEEQGGDSDELQAVMRKLGDAEKQGSELQRHLDEMENENVRIKLAAKENSGKQADVASPDSDMLRNLVGNQQRTIGNLQNLLRGLPSDSGKAKELDEVINKIQRTNNDLSSCVMVLEDENDHLREKVETLQKRVDDLESSVTEVPETAAIPASVVDAATTDMPTDTAAQEVNTDTDEFDVDTLLAASAPIEEPAAIDLEESEDDVDTLLDAAAADSNENAAVSEPISDTDAVEKPAAVDPAQDVSPDADEFDVDALLAASGPVAKPTAIDPATSDDDNDALLDVAAADSKEKAAVSEPESDTDAVEKPAAVDSAQDVSPDTDNFDVDALLAASASNSGDVEEQAEPVPTTVKPASLAQGEGEQDDIDALLADLFSGNTNTDDDSKS